VGPLLGHCGRVVQLHDSLVYASSLLAQYPRPDAVVWAGYVSGHCIHQVVIAALSLHLGRQGQHCQPGMAQTASQASQGQPWSQDCGAGSCNSSNDAEACWDQGSSLAVPCAVPICCSLYCAATTEEPQQYDLTSCSCLFAVAADGSTSSTQM
jgi:hypothetical protein